MWYHRIDNVVVECTDNRRMNAHGSVSLTPPFPPFMKGDPSLQLVYLILPLIRCIPESITVKNGGTLMGSSTFRPDNDADRKLYK